MIRNRTFQEFYPTKKHSTSFSLQLHNLSNFVSFPTTLIPKQTLPTFACLRNNFKIKNNASLLAFGSVKRSLNFLPLYDSKIANFETSSPVEGNTNDQSSDSKYADTLNCFIKMCPQEIRCVVSKTMTFCSALYRHQIITSHGQ